MTLAFDLSSLSEEEREYVMQVALERSLESQGPPKLPDPWREWLAFCEASPKVDVADYRTLLDEAYDRG